MDPRVSFRAIAAFELRRALQRRAVVLASVLVPLGLVAAHWEHWRDGAPPNGEIFGLVYLLGALLVVRFGLGEDRRLHFDEYLIVNHASSTSYIAGKAVALAGVIVLYGIGIAVLETVYGGSAERALWLAAAFTLAAWFFAPFVMLVEVWADTALPGALVMLVWIVLVATLYFTTGSRALADLPGFTTLASGSWTSMRPLAVRSLVGVPIAFVAVGALVRLRLPRC